MSSLESKSKLVQNSVKTIFDELLRMSQKDEHHPMEMHNFFTTLTDTFEEVEKEAYNKGFEEGKKNWHKTLASN